MTRMQFEKSDIISRVESKPAMALPSTFHERLDQMENTRNQRLSLLQAEKELQNKNYQILASKIGNIRAVEQRCLNLERTIASQKLLISSLKPQIDKLHSNYHSTLFHLRELKNEVRHLEELEAEKGRYYSSECQKMDDFRAQNENFLVECQVQIEELRSLYNSRKIRFSELQGKLNCSGNSEIALAERTKSELMAKKDIIDQNLASNYCLREQLRKQLQLLLAEQDRERKRIDLIAQHTSRELS